MLSQQTASATGEHLVTSLAEARTLTDKLFEVVRPENLYDRPIPERHRIAFYIGHLEAFDWNLIGRNILDLHSFDESLDHLFAFGIDPVGGGLPNDQASDWPAMQQIQLYNRTVRESLDTALEKSPFSDPALPLLQDGYALHVAIEHRLMHAETLAYMLHQLPLESKLRDRPDAPISGPPAAPRVAKISAGTATLGLTLNGDGAFGWDNEFEAQEVAVPEFEIDVYNVTNAGFLKFMNAGGYESRSFWTDADWRWRTEQGVKHPLFWVQRGGQWFYRAMFGEVPLPLDWPAYTSHAEAAAYLRWVGKELPTEAQIHRAAYGMPQGNEREFPWGNELPDRQYGNFDFHNWDPSPVGAFPAGASAFGIADLVGNGWEWTSTTFAPLPGFKPFSFYPGYSANFFDGQHYVMKGGSSRTAAALLRRSFRNWFQPHYPYVYAKFRGVSNAS